MPNFCKNTSIFIIVITAILIATAVTLLTSFDLLTFSLTSFYIVWLFLLWAVGLCLVGKLECKPTKRFIYSFILCMVVFIAYELVAQKIYFGTVNLDRLFRFSFISFIFIALTLRSLQLSGIYSKRSRNDLQNKFNALQARIEPHFLFNSLNTIAELTHVEPKMAESAIDSLATILRSNLKDDNMFHSLEDEISLCEKYIQLEKWRLDKRLTTSITVDSSAKSAIVPKLIVQPLVENAIKHGIAPFIHGGKVSIDIKTASRKIMINVLNTTSKKNSLTDQDLEYKNEGHGIAIDNTRERLFVVYDDKYKIKASQSQNSYNVTIEIPKTPPKQMAIHTPD